MNKGNIIPLILPTILIGLICIFSILRLNNLSIWQDTTINFDIVISCIYVVWMIFESKISKKEPSKGNKTSDFGTCELYAIGQAGVFLSALWFNSVWKDPNIFHFFGLLIFILIFLLVLIPAIILRILIEEKTLFKIQGYPEFAKSRKRLIPAIW